MSNSSYLEIKNFHFQRITGASVDPIHLNLVHDEIYKQVIELALEKLKNVNGPPPCPFTFFVTGSAGRMEQSIWSDQDHGIIFYNNCKKEQVYFLQLGKEISEGLSQAGYSYCKGGVMSSNPLWCKSITEWQGQINSWIEQSSWETIRYLLIFLDARNLLGEQTYINLLKKQIFLTLQRKRMMTLVLNNSLYYKKGINLIGNLLFETHGPYSGTLNLKETAFIPYANAVRLLAIKEGLLESPTLLRLNGLRNTAFPSIKVYETQFNKLLHYRLAYCDHTNYESGHYLSIKNLTKAQIGEVKDILKHGTTLLRTVKKLLEKGDLNGHP
ncbi:DUF294 nucleotidyltransferase-like domain-containing protein [Neobacillus mesonae]|uniref:DUF294 nucleotidyltransferase-like domain-containing protein n=1 Tax=Neobacillus mesonae TaxID=1193713 RepID=UPI00203D4F1A|nr:DUF294 nucleotidyltransferase-like domain-containing protein [Neobacillus mesonae]MCM3569757.1 DUF294 nucleotidyltransferase-like domain-containing protein [Neobacillus mesonae]